jgi:nucleotide-binding universal stress UspA family protein
MCRCVRVTKVFSNEREIVVGVDGSEHSTDAVKWAAREARLREAVLRLICVAPIGSDIDFDWSVDDSLAESQEIVDHAREAAEAFEPTVVARGEVLVGPVAETLVGASEVTDLLVVGARGAGALSEFFLGSISRACVSEARCPVVIVHELGQPAIPGSPLRIVVEVQQGRDSDALNWAIEEAVLRSARVEAVFDCGTSSDKQGTGHQNPECNEWTSEFTRFTASYTQPQATNGGPFVSRARCISTTQALLEACQGADLLVMSGVGLEGRHEWGEGSLLRRCVQLAPCPVVVVGPTTSGVPATHP